MTIQNTSTWFVNGDVNLYYTTTWNQNFTSTIKFPPKILRAYFGPIPPTGTDYTNGIKKLIDSIGNLAISCIIASPEAKNLRYIPFAWLEKDTQDILRRGVCEFIQNACVNSTIMERLLANGISAPNFSVNEDTTSWFLSSDTLGQYLRILIGNSGIKDYEIVNEDFIQARGLNGNTLILRTLSEYDILNLNPTITGGK